MRLRDVVYQLGYKDIDNISKIKTLSIYKTKTTSRNEKLEKILS